MSDHTVTVHRAPLTLPTYRPAPPDQNPMFLENRVYQGSSGRVYPLPFYDRIEEKPVDQDWDAVTIANEFVEVTILPQLGGRIFAARDKTNGYDLFYRHSVIKPALVGLAGPWISGGVEFNWPQHHRPATYMPCDVHIEEHADGSKTVWLSDHEPMNRMKGMHGVCIHPGKSLIELKVRLYNRTDFTQTFLWWANVATAVHEQYQSFFPPDVQTIADHAKRATSRFPRGDGKYYGVDYAKRGKRGVPQADRPRKFVPPGTYSPDDLTWYANIPVPTSYMCLGSTEDFFGGYDHAARAGVVHVCSHHISPGKKQWTWGNHEFGYRWDRLLSDDDRPYIEIMAGVYTDNQPDFSFLAPGETRTFSQFWYPIREIGPAHKANLEAALHLQVKDGTAKIGVSVTSELRGAEIQLLQQQHKARPFRAGAPSAQRVVKSWRRDLSPAAPFIGTVKVNPKSKPAQFTLEVRAAERVVIRYTPNPMPPAKVPPPATEPPAPAKIDSTDELYLTGLHLDQYRHATRRPEIYWREALRRDPLDSRCNNAIGLWHLRRGEFTQAETHFRRAIERITIRNPNPRDGEPYYNLGLALRFQRRDDDAYAAFYKACWNQAWQAPGFFALAQIDCARRDFAAGLDHVDRALRLNVDYLQARNLKAIILGKLQRHREASALLEETIALDPLDWQARFLHGEPIGCDTQTRLDLSLDFWRAGMIDEALVVLADAKPNDAPGSAPLLHYYRAFFAELIDRDPTPHVKMATNAYPDHCFPNRLEEIPILQRAIERDPRDALARYYLGNLFYDRRRHREAIRLWETSAKIDPNFSIVWRNLGIGYFNVTKQPAKAKRAYDRALKANPADARLLFERDQLHKRLGVSPKLRLRELEKHPALVSQRDDLSVEICALFNQLGQCEKAQAILASRDFQPWEGGEGLALAQHTRTHLLLGQRALASNDAKTARALFEKAMEAPANLGEARHLLANQSDAWYWLGCACEQLHDRPAAQAAWHRAAGAVGDFQQMQIRAFSEMTYYSALAMKKLGKPRQAAALLRSLLNFAHSLRKSPATIDYFATSLPTMLLFEDDLTQRQRLTADLLQAQAQLALGQRKSALKLLRRILRLDPAHALANDLLAFAK